MHKISKILVITDNPYLAQRFEKEVWSEVDKGFYSLTFKCSPYSEASAFNLEDSISKIDLKNPDLVNSILNYDLVISIHCKQLFPKKLIENIRCINVHPGYNPINRGWYPQVFSILRDLDIGATIHEIDEKLDHGKIIDRKKVKKYSYDTSLTLYNRVVEQEIELLKTNIHSILKNDYKTFNPENDGNMFLKKDFNELCKLDLGEQLTMGEAIDKLRALTHGEYKNAFFINTNGEKIFVSLNIEK